jgi:hypothetical protein
MSSFTRIKTQMVEREYLVRALEDLGYTCEEGDVKVRGFGGQRARVEIKVTPKGSLLQKIGLGHDIGFRKAGAAYEIVADWWGIQGVNRKQFLQQVTRRYAYHAARAKLEEQGFELASEEVQEGERIHLVLRRMA